MRRSQIAAVSASAILFTAFLAWGAIAGAEPVMGIVAADGDAAIAASAQPGAAEAGAVTIDRVVTPEDAFVVVHASDDGMPGMRLGYAAVPAGESRDVVVELEADAEVTPEVLAAVHADRGKPGEFEFDMENMEHSPDRPFFVGGMEVATAISVR